MYHHTNTSVTMALATDVDEDKTTAGVLYGQLPEYISAKELGLAEKTNVKKSKLVKSFLVRHIAQNKAAKAIDSLQHKTQALENMAILTKKPWRKKAANTFGGKKRGRKTLTVREKRKLRLLEFRPEEQRYEMYLPLNQLWVDYMGDILQFERLDKSGGISQAEEKLLRADLHGCLLTVTQTRCPSLVGLSGIVVQETRNTMRIISPDNKLRTIPKENSVFTIGIRDYVITVYGNNFKYKSSERASHRYKARTSIDL